jgi:hypothetical protein
MVKNRSIVTALILTIVTCGIYGIYWMAALQNESLAAAKEEGTSGAMAVVLTIVTCGIYGFYWAYKLGERIDRINGSQNSGVIYLILQFFGLGIVAYCLAQDGLNKSGQAR